MLFIPFQIIIISCLEFIVFGYGFQIQLSNLLDVVICIRFLKNGFKFCMVLNYYISVKDCL